MNIGVIGVGNIGATVTRRLSAAGHQLKVANSRGPQTIPADVLSTGARAVHAAEVSANVEVLIVSVPLHRVPSIASLMDRLPSSAVVIDTSNYYPLRDGQIRALDDGQVESLWVAEKLGRSVVKAWNAIGSGSFEALAAPAGSPDRLAIPVAADDAEHRRVGMALVEETGFDAFDAGTLADSWRQQPGAPVYCTDLNVEQLSKALDTAVAEQSPRRRDLAFSVIMEVLRDREGDPRADFLVPLNRLLYMSTLTV